MSFLKFVMLKYLLFLVLPVLVFSCFHDTKKTDDSSPVFDSDSISIRLRYSDVLFEVPSPYQTSFYLKKLNIRFDERLLNSESTTRNFTTNFNKALAIGVYGTDISYLNLYDQKELTIRYIDRLNNLLTDIDVLKGLDKSCIKKLEDNLGNNDSLVYYLSVLYHDGDSYLYENDRRDIGSQIIAGGWIESIYILTMLYQKNNNEEILNLILYQSEILDNLIKLLAPYYEKSKEFTELIDSLINIAYEFDLIDKKEYKFETITDTVRHHTLINTHSKFILNGSKLDNLSKLVKEIRNKLIL
jgi:hypothetical protein